MKHDEPILKIVEFLFQEVGIKYSLENPFLDLLVEELGDRIDDLIAQRSNRLIWLRAMGIVGKNERRN